MFIFTNEIREQKGQSMIFTEDEVLRFCALLTPREEVLLRMRYNILMEDQDRTLSLRELGERFAVTPERVSSFIKKIVTITLPHCMKFGERPLGKVAQKRKEWLEKQELLYESYSDDPRSIPYGAFVYFRDEFRTASVKFWSPSWKKHLGIETLGDLASFSPEELLKKKIAKTIKGVVAIRDLLQSFEIEYPYEIQPPEESPPKKKRLSLADQIVDNWQTAYSS